MDILWIVLLVIVLALPAYLIGSVLSYFLLWWCLRKMPKPILRTMFWE